MDSFLATLLASCRAYRDLPLERIRTFEPGHYTDPEFYELELRHIWLKEWINVGHDSEVDVKCPFEGTSQAQSSPR